MFMITDTKPGPIEVDEDTKKRHDCFRPWLDKHYADLTEGYRQSLFDWINCFGFYLNKPTLYKGENPDLGIEVLPSAFQYSPDYVDYILNQFKDRDIYNKIDRDHHGAELHPALTKYKEFLSDPDKYVNQSNGGEDSMEDQIDKYVEMLKRVHNIIFHGAPGTGKTYMARRIAKQIIGFPEEEDLNQSENFAFVQFHPSYDYTDFVEGLRPITNRRNGEMSFQLYPGTFMKISNRARRDWEASVKKGKEEYFKENGKNYKDQKKDKELKQSAFKYAKANAPKYVIVIDEINRGDISKIFGELFFSVDPDYRGESGSIDTQYRNLHGREFKKRGGLDSDEKFYVPENLYIIGTMNDIDRSVDSFDFAMRRRFTFIEITAEESEFMLCGDEKHSEKAKAVMKAVNDKIASPNFLDENYQIGASYFLDVINPKIGESDEKEAYKHLWDDKIGPLIHEYLRGMDDDSSTSLDAIKDAFDDAVAGIKKSNDGAESNSQSNSDSNSTNIKNNQQDASQSDDNSSND